MIRLARLDEILHLAGIDDAAQARFEGTLMALVPDVRHSTPRVAVSTHVKAGRR